MVRVARRALDVVEPKPREIIPDAPSIETPEAAEGLEEQGFAEADAAPLNKNPKPDAAPAEPPRKGGPLAQRAAIACGEKGFWTFIAKKFGAAVASSDEAAAWVKARCGVKSRIDLDYEAGPAAAFHDIDKTYRLWLEGFD